MREYLPAIVLRRKWFSEKQNITVGDSVYLVDEPFSKDSGRLGKVVQTYPDDKEVVRSVRLRVRNSELVQPMTKLRLYLLVEGGVNDM